jgi:hypothetical protein
MTEAITTSSKSRRALLAGALGGLGAWAATAVGRAAPARADNGDPVLAGQTTEATSATVLLNIANGTNVLEVKSQLDGTAIRGESDDGIGVIGDSNGNSGVLGTSTTGPGVVGSSDSVAGVVGSSDGGIGVLGQGATTGLLGFSGSGVTPSAKPKTGVYGQATQDFGSRGVWGRSNAGRGVYGQATNGVGLYGSASNGYALRTNGRVKMDRVSGVASIPAGSTSVTVAPNVNVTTSTFVLLTPKANIGSRGLWFSTNASADSFTIRMSSSRSSNTKVAWLLLG